MNIEKIQSIIESKAGEVTGEFGVSFVDLKSGQSCFLCGDKAFPSASVFKVYLLAELFRQVKEGAIKLDTRLELTEGNKTQGSGVLAVLDGGLKPTIKDHATLMMILSDNTSTDILFNLIGSKAIYDNVLKPLGLTKTKCDLSCSQLISIYYELNNEETYLQANGNKTYRNTPAYTGNLEQNDETTPLEIAKIFELFYKGQWQGRETDDAILEILKKCQTNSRLPRLLPPDTTIAHKTGTMDRLVNDAGIVYTDKGDYILCMFYNGNTATEQEYAENAGNVIGEKLLAELSKEVFAAYTAN